MVWSRSQRIASDVNGRERLSFFAYAIKRPSNLKWTTKCGALVHIEQVELRVHIQRHESHPSHRWQSDERAIEWWLVTCLWVCWDNDKYYTCTFAWGFVCLPPSIRVQAMDQSENKEWAWCKRWLPLFVLWMVVCLCVNERERSVYVCLCQRERKVSGRREPWFVRQINHNGLNEKTKDIAIPCPLGHPFLLVHASNRIFHPNRGPWTKAKEGERDKGKRMTIGWWEWAQNTLTTFERTEKEE